jgi:hypothetical protein
MKKGTIVKLIDPQAVKGGRIGDLAIVEDDDKYPDLYKAMLRETGSEMIKEFICVTWLCEMPSMRPEKNGYYLSSRFETVKIKERNV